MFQIDFRGFNFSHKTWTKLGTEEKTEAEVDTTQPRLGVQRGEKGGSMSIGGTLLRKEMWGNYLPTFHPT